MGLSTSTWSPAPACVGKCQGHSGEDMLGEIPRHRPREQTLSSCPVLGGDLGEPH